MKVLKIIINFIWSFLFWFALGFAAVTIGITLIKGKLEITPNYVLRIAAYAFGIWCIGIGIQYRKLINEYYRTHTLDPLKDQLKNLK